MYLLLERGEWSQGEREEENRERKHQCARETWISCTSLPPAGDLVHNLGTCPTTWVLVPAGNRTADLGLQASAQSTEPHQPQHGFIFL